MKKVLIFNGYYYPSKNCGGPITSLENIVNGCHDEFEFYILCYNHDFNDSKSFIIETKKWHSVGNAKVMYVEPKYLDYSVKNMKKVFSELKPDLIWFSGVLTPNNKVVSVLNARKLGIPVLFSPRGEVSADRVQLKAYKKIPYLNLLRITGIYRGCYFHGTSDDEIDGLKKYFNPDNNHIFKVPNIAIMQQKDVVLHQKIEGDLKLFFFSRIHEVKNILFGIKCVSKCKNIITFDIYGPIESTDYWKQCEEIIKNAPDNIHIKYCGILQHDNMSECIQAHDAFLFPTINENYGHVIAESLANSRPVILSKGTTPWDDLNGRAGFCAELDDETLFIEKIEYLAELNNDEYNDLIKNTKEYFIEKVGKDEAIQGHKKMIRNILESGD